MPYCPRPREIPGFLSRPLQPIGIPIVRFVNGELVKLGCVGVVFVLFSPVYVFMFRPQDDVRYYFLHPVKVELGTADELRHNQFVRVTGQVEPATFQVHHQGLLGLKTDFKFRLEGYPDTLAVCVEEGPLHGELLAAFNRDHVTPAGKEESPKLENLIAGKFEKTIRAKMFGAEEFDPAWTNMGKILAEEQTIEGRLHDSNASRTAAFGTFAPERDTRIVDYFGRVLGLDAQAGKLWVIDAAETPDPARFLDGNGALIMFGFLLGLFVIGWIFRWLFKGPSTPARSLSVTSGRSPLAPPPSSPSRKRPPPLPGRKFD